MNAYENNGARIPYTVVIDTFHGVDLTSAPDAVAADLSPCCENMIRDVPGKIRKCMGYKTVLTLDGRINGAHVLRVCNAAESGAPESVLLIHAGTKLYRVHGTPGITLDGALTAECVYEDMADARSRSFQFAGAPEKRDESIQYAGKLYLLDGKNMLVWDGETVRPVSDIAYVPLVTISRDPDGGGHAYEALNLMQPKFKERFLGQEDAKAYCLSFAPLDADTTVTVRVRTESGWEEKTQGTRAQVEAGDAGKDFWVDYAKAVITFAVAPGVSPVSGEDNVEITAKRTVPGYAARINRCTVGILYGVGGTPDRLFVSGNPDYPDRDWFSGVNDPTYWPDTNYSVLGTYGGDVMGYSIVGGYLAAHKSENSHSIVLRTGQLMEGEAVFTVVNTLQGPGAVSKDSFAVLGGEPVFLTELGVYAATTADITGERSIQNRSYYLNGALLEEPALSNAFACTYRDMYWLCTGDKAYILDGVQPLAANASLPYANRQYAGFLRTNLPARVMWERDGMLWFGTQESQGGKVKIFYNDPQTISSYNDDGAPIRAQYVTPDLTGGDFGMAKSFKRFELLVGAAIRMCVTAEAQAENEWHPLLEAARNSPVFSFSKMRFSEMRFGGKVEPFVLHCRTNFRNLDRIRYRILNDGLDEPLFLKALSSTYHEKYRYRK